jgi:demethylmenaquinone methyltransferase/2-methoxy-6-polyprenyl-1,4-benzoquinol methylase
VNKTLDIRDSFVERVFATVAPRFDFLSRMFSLGLSAHWRRKALRLSGVGEGDRVLDICTGTGALAFLLARMVGRRGSVVGVDFSRPMLDIAQKKKASLPDCDHLTFLYGDAKALDFPARSFDAVTVGFGMRNVRDTEAALKEVRRVLRQGGRFVCLELTQPPGRWVRRLYGSYVFRVIPVVSGLLLKDCTPYRYMARSIFGFSTPLEFREVMESSGFRVECMHIMLHGIATIYVASVR